MRRVPTADQAFGLWLHTFHWSVQLSAVLQ